jgi:S-formylglutathione hydrolase FrmB
MIKIKKKQYLVHKVVAYAHGKITRDKFYSRVEGVVEHKDNDKTNFAFDNLDDGTAETNGLARHDNPTTTLRKRVRRTHIEHGTIVEYESRRAAAAANNCCGKSIKNAIRNTTWRGYSWEFIENTIA